MYSYVARQPILNADKALFAYELLFRDGKSNSYPDVSPDVSPDEATSKLLAQNHLTLGLGELTNDKFAFINFHEDTLLHDFPTSLPTQDIYIKILKDVPLSAKIIVACKRLKKMGYRLVLDHHDFDPKWEMFLPFIDIINVDIRQTNLLKINKFIRHLEENNDNHIQLLAENVETEQEFEQLKLLGFSYFQGYFFAKPEIVKQKIIAPNKFVLMELISETSKLHMSVNKISQLIERDVSLSYKLLRFINSSAFNQQQKIGSLKHALTYMGELEMKKFISLIALANLSAGKPSELLSLSVIRAKFCAQVSDKLQVQQNPPMAFLTGLFSLVDALLDQQLAIIVDKLPICLEIKAALTADEGQLAKYLKLAIYYEKGQWEQLEALCKKLKLSTEQASDFYLHALQWANGFDECTV